MLAIPKFVFCFVVLFCDLYHAAGSKLDILALVTSKGEDYTAVCEGRVSGYYGAPKASTKRGVLQGKYVTTSNNFTGTAFYGVAYGQPPIGKYRFAKSDLPKPWKGVQNATEYGPACPQNSSFSSYQPDWVSEDCLWLAIYAPKDTLDVARSHRSKNTNRMRLYPILYYIHGGNWEFDSNRMFPEAQMFENFVANGLIIVTVSYRMNGLGFFSTGTRHAPGNYGLLDMILGLEWVQENIADLGGDPERVTIMGHSSAGFAVSVLSMSPLTEGLFSQAVPMSGSALVRGSTDQNLDQYKRTAISLGCVSEEDWDNQLFDEMMDCLLDVDAQTFTNTYLYSGSKVTKSTGTIPRIDGPGGVLPHSISELSRNRRGMNFLTGTTNVEFSIGMRNEEQPTPEVVRDICAVIASSFGDQNDAISDACNFHYNAEVRNQEKTTFYNQPLKEIVADFLLYGPSYQDAKTVRERGGNSFLYSFEYTSKILENVGAYHSIDLTYIFGIHCFPLDTDDLKIREIYSDVFSNFAIHGEPGPGTDWTPLTKPTGFNYYKIDLNSTYGEFYRFNAVEFWNRVVPYLERFGKSNKSKAKPERISGLSSAAFQEIMGYEQIDQGSWLTTLLKIDTNTESVRSSSDLQNKFLLGENGTFVALGVGFTFTVAVLVIAGLVGRNPNVRRRSSLPMENAPERENYEVRVLDEMSPLLPNEQKQ